MDLRFYLALIVGKISAFVLKLKGSGATAAPGLYALSFDPNFVKKFSKQITNGSIIICGTNGKTTTSRIISDLLASKYKIIHNRQGSNLLRGLASTFINNSSFLGKVDCSIALWEIDEAVLPQIIKDTNPKTLVLLNLFRDQLDRYGEVDSIRKSWQTMLLTLPKTTQVILNEDDPGIKYLEKFAGGKITTFGIEDKKVNLPKTTNVSDIKQCPNCSSKLIYTSIFFAHIGHYTCTSCSLKRTSPIISASNLIFERGFKTSMRLALNKQKLNLNLNIPGLYNVYNILAAGAVSYSENLDGKLTKTTLEQFSSAFGRYQKFNVSGKEIIVFLIKNPTGANEILKTIYLQEKLNILVILNDKIADGRDVSWIWDTNWEIISKKVSNIFISGSRSWDLANRLKYAGLKLSNKNVCKQINYSIRQAIVSLNNKDTLIVLPTYTALLETQKILSKLARQEKWHQN